MKNTIKTITATALLFVAFTSQANAADAWGAVAPVVKKKPVVAMGGWGAPVPVVNALAADERAYKHATHGVFDKATHEAVLSSDIAKLKVSHGNLTQANFALNGALGFAEVIKAAHANISAYLATGGKTLAGSLAAGEGTPWAEDAAEAMVTGLNVAGIAETLSDGATPISSLSANAALGMLEGADSADKSALIVGLQAEAARIDAAAKDTSGTDALDALVTNLQIRAFIKMVA